MRTVLREGPLIKVTDDPDGVVGEFLGLALSLKTGSGRPHAEEFADLFSPEGKGLRLPDTFAAYRADEPGAVPPEFGEHTAEELERGEIWVLTRLRYGKTPDSALVQGPELRRLLAEALVWAAEHRRR